MKTYLLWVALLIVPFISKGQSSGNIDSLLPLLNDSKMDTFQMQVCRSIGDLYMNANNRKAVQYFERANRIAQKLNRTLDLANNNYSIAYCMSADGNYKGSIENYLKAARVYEKLKDWRRLVNTYLSMTSVYAELKNFEKGFEYLSLSDALITRQKDSSQRVTWYNQAGSLHYKKGSYDSAFHFLHKSTYLSRILKDTIATIANLGNTGLMYKSIDQYDSAIHYYKLALALTQTQQNVNDYLAQLYNNLGSAYLQNAKYDEAYEAIKRSLVYAGEVGGTAIVMENYNTLAELYAKKGDYKNQSIYLEKYYHYKDSLNTYDARNKLTELEADYQLEKKDATIEKQNHQRNLFIVLVLSLLILLSLIFYFFKRLEWKKKLLEALNKQIQKQNLELESLNTVKDRILGILGHDLKSPLLTFKSYLMMDDSAQTDLPLKQHTKRNALQSVVQTSDMIDNLVLWAHLQLKNEAVHLIPFQIDDCIQDVLGLIKLQAEQKQLKIQYQNNPSFVYADYQLLSIALRNLITNAIKFSYEKGNIYINTFSKDNHTIIEIKDEGVGMLPEKMQEINSMKTKSLQGTANEKGSGLGLFFVRSLLQSIHASLEIESEIHKGSTFRIVLN